MTHYITKPTPGRPALNDVWWDRTVQPLGHPMVFDREPAPTGILDPNGHQIYRMPDPIGFLHGQHHREDDR